MRSSFVCPSIRAHYLAVQLNRIVDQRSAVRCLSSCVLNNVRSKSYRSSCRVLSESSSFLSSYTTSGSDYHLRKRFAHTPHLTQDVVRDTLEKSNSERVLSVKHSNLSEAASSLVYLTPSHFDIRNLTREEHDFAIFVPDKLSKLQDISLVKHPIIETALELFDEYKYNSRISLGGFCVLLIAKCLQSLPSHTPSQETWDKQKALAECYELLDKAMYLHHYGVIDIRLDSSNNETIKTLNSGNKLAVLSGNYLFSFATHRLAKIVRQPIIFDYVGASIDEFCIKHFGNLQKPGIGKTGHPWADVDMKYWEKYGGYCSTDLLAYSCQSVAMLAGLSSVRFERSAFEFGHNLKLLWNLYDDLENLTLKKSKINLISAPFVEYLKQHPVFRDYLVNVESVDTNLLQKIHQLVISNDIIDNCRALLLQYSNQCIQSLEIFPKCPSRDFLESLCREFQDIT